MLSFSDLLLGVQSLVPLDDVTVFVLSPLLEPSPERKSFLLSEGPNGLIQKNLPINLCWPGQLRS